MVLIKYISHQKFFHFLKSLVQGWDHAQGARFNPQHCINFVGRLRPIMPAVLRQRQEAQKFKVILGYEFNGNLGYRRLQCAPLGLCLTREIETVKISDWTEWRETCVCSL